jgi:glycosyltransferase involved in cell wall biosynthesis
MARIRKKHSPAFKAQVAWIPRLGLREGLIQTIGRGVVASDLPFFRDVLAAETQAGVLFPPGDPRKLAQAIEEFFGTSTGLRHKAARRIADRYDWGHTIRPVVDWLERTFSEKLSDSKLATGHSSGEKTL